MPLADLNELNNPSADSCHPKQTGVPVRKCILIVDDNRTIRHMLRTTFEDIWDWEVGEAENGRDAIDKARESKPDLIVLDLSMPVMNGLEAAPLLKQMLPAVLIILFTLHDNKTLERKALSVGVSAVVSKADSMKTLLKQAEDLLRASGVGVPIGETQPVPFNNP
jgi:CheY-like chemotaxis protein